MGEISISGSNYRGTIKLCTGQNNDLGSVMHGTAYKTFWAGTVEGFLIRGPT